MILKVRILVAMYVGNQRGRARFVVAKARGVTACPLPNLLDSGEVLSTQSTKHKTPSTIPKTQTRAFFTLDS